MKTAIYIEDGVVQLVLTPESDWEKSALTTFKDKPIDAKLFGGSFYGCQGGWIRQRDHSQGVYYGPHDRSDDSLIIVARTQ